MTNAASFDWFSFCFSLIEMICHFHIPVELVSCPFPCRRSADIPAPVTEESNHPLYLRDSLATLAQSFSEGKNSAFIIF